jgi:hypothetical protein
VARQSIGALDGNKRRCEEPGVRFTKTEDKNKANGRQAPTL